MPPRLLPVAVFACAVLASVPMLPAQTAPWAAAFSLKDALSAPFNSALSAAPAGSAVAWVMNAEGRRNLWVATRVEDAPGKQGKYAARQLTRNADDNGIDLGELAWSRDGEKIAFVQGGDLEFPGHPSPNPALLPGGVEQTIWVAGLHEAAAVKITAGRSPHFTAAGDALVYLFDNQLWTVKLAPGSKPEQLLHTRGELDALTLSPDGASLAFVTHRSDHSFIGVYNFAARSLTYLAPSGDNDDYPAWSPDSRQIAFVRSYAPSGEFEFAPHRSSPLTWSLYIGDVATGHAHEIWTAETGPGSIYRPMENSPALLWTGTGRILFPWEMDGWLHIWSAPVTGGAARLLTPGSYEAEDAALSPDRKTLVYSSNEDDIDRRHCWRVNLGEPATPVRITTGDGIELAPVITGSGSVVVLRSDAHTPTRPALVTDSALADLAPETIPPSYPGGRFVTPQQVILSAADGMQIHAQLFLPPAATAPAGGEPVKHPALVFFHGGSRRQMLLGYHYMDYYSNAYAMNQYLASRGYVVLSVNYRSGIGYGLNFREALNYGAAGASEFNDVLGAGLYLRSRTDVDPARIGSWGGSYGGYLTALALARSSALFAAGVDFHGVHDWNIELGNWNTTFDPTADPGRARLAWESSPIASVSTWRSPVLLIQGDDDRNVQFSQTPLLAAALRKQGVPVEELVFPDEIHGFLMHRSWLAAYTATDEFFARKLSPAMPGH